MKREEKRREGEGSEKGNFLGATNLEGKIATPFSKNVRSLIPACPALK
jgi:hypothetical protein